MQGDNVYVKQVSYFIDILKLALEKSGVANKTKAVKIPKVIDSRYALMFEKDMFDVIWLHTNTKFESRFLPVRIPLFKGLIGLRVLVVKKDKLPMFQAINTLEALKQKFAGQGHDWPDTEILRANNFGVITSIHPENLFGMLMANRLDYFPRSILEVQNELQQSNRSEQLTIEPSLTLRYPTAFYFFVRKGNNALAKILEQGLKLAVKDGSFDQVFYRYFSEDINLLNFSQRKVFELTEPKEMFSHLPLDQKELWLKTAGH
jgi:hypothetical protein